MKMSRNSLLFLLLLCSILHAGHIYVAVVETISDKNVITRDEKLFLTDKLRESAQRVLPSRMGYVIMTRENIQEMLPPGKVIEDCEGQCLVETGKNINANYIAQARAGRVGSKLSLTVELYATNGANVVSYFTIRSSNVDGLVDELERKADGMFRAITVGKSNSGHTGFSDLDLGQDYKGDSRSFYLVHMDTRPTGAMVSIDGRPNAGCRSTPCGIELVEGEHSFSFAMEEYSDKDTVVNVRANGERYIVDLMPNFGILTINPATDERFDDIEGLSIFVDDALVSSKEIRLSPQRKHKIQIKSACYEPVSFEVSVKKGDKIVFDKPLVAAKGTLLLRATKDNQPVSEMVYIDGRPMGNTPFNKDIPICSKIAIGKNQNPVPVRVKYHDKTDYTYVLESKKKPQSEGSGRPGQTYDSDGADFDTPRDVVYIFFDEQYRPGGFDYAYGGSSKGITITKDGGYKSKAALNIKLDPRAYSGASISLYNETFNLKKLMQWDSRLEFMVKGKNGNENFSVGLLDEDISDGKKTMVRLPVNKFIQGGSVTRTWKKVSIPLAAFPARGLYWDNKRKVEIPARVEWDKISEIRFAIDKSGDREFEMWVDNIVIVKGKNQVSPKKDIVYWDENDDVINGPRNPERLDGKAKAFATFYDNGVKGFSYSYGGLTSQREARSGMSGNPNVLAMYIDNNDWSGVTYSLGEGKYFDLSRIRNKGGLYFWIKGKLGGEKIYVGILDNQGNDTKTQTKISLNDWIEGGKVGTDWKLVKIPLKRFSDKGRAWDANKQVEVLKDMQWSKIQEIRFSVNKNENKGEQGKPSPVTIFVDQITFTENIDWVDSDVKWDDWSSRARDVVITDFEGVYAQDVWELSKGPNSKASFEMPYKSTRLDGNSLMVKNYELHDWVDFVLDFIKNKSRHSDIQRDWSKHWGLMFDVFSEKAWQPITIQVHDSGHELFVANTGAPKGRSTVIVPFKNFIKFPYYQPPNAKQNGVFDLNGVVALDFKPGGEGSRGRFEIDNIALTNQKKVKESSRPSVIPVVVKGTDNVYNSNISKNIFGINAALWDGDLLDNPKFKVQTRDFVRRVNHGIIRYPGGLRADDDHWKEILDNKDWMIDTDEFLEWLKKTGSKAMFTVNFGSGTEQEAAAWVKHANIDKKAGVKYWEIGDEVFGNWHPYYEKYGKDGGTIYGKRARKFIEAMKRVDPSIKVAVVGVLDGAWNDNVLKETGDIADGIIIHHFPQHFGEENDFAMLSAPQELAQAILRLRKVVDKWSDRYNKDKKIELWLTEWNSVDFNPGPQTLSVEQGLFVADYLGMLATLRIDNAQYWDVHNDLTEERGDYGYLTRSAEPCMNCPRPSYWAFRMASDALRGKLYKTEIRGDNDSFLTTYYTINDGKKSLLVINKSPYSDYDLKIDIPGFRGRATIQTLDKTYEILKEGWANDPSKKTKTVDVSEPIRVGKRSLSLITVE